MTLTSLNRVYLSNEINKFFPMNGKVTVNATLSLLENSYTKSLNVKRDVQTKLIEVIQVNYVITLILDGKWFRMNSYELRRVLYDFTFRLEIVILEEATYTLMDL